MYLNLACFVVGLPPYYGWTSARYELESETGKEQEERQKREKRARDPRFSTTLTTLTEPSRDDASFRKLSLSDTVHSTVKQNSKRLWTRAMWAHNRDRLPGIFLLVLLKKVMGL